MTTLAPAYHTFTHGRQARRGTVKDFLTRLTPGTPALVEPGLTTSQDPEQLLRVRAGQLRIPVSFREIDGRLWVCRLLPEDVLS